MACDGPAGPHPPPPPRASCAPHTRPLGSLRTHQALSGLCPSPPTVAADPPCPPGNFPQADQSIASSLQRLWHPAAVIPFGFGASRWATHLPRTLGCERHIPVQGTAHRGRGSEWCWCEVQPRYPPDFTSQNCLQTHLFFENLHGVSGFENPP